MNKLDIQYIINKYIYPEPDIMQDMLLEYRNYSWDMINKTYKSIQNFNTAICAYGYANECWFVQWATYQLLFQNKNIDNIIILSVDETISDSFVLWENTLYAGFGDMFTKTVDRLETSSELKIFEKWLYQLPYIYVYHKIKYCTIIACPNNSEIIKKTITKIKNNLNTNTWFVISCEFSKYDKDIHNIKNKDEYISIDQIILNKFFIWKIMQKDFVWKNYPDKKLLKSFSDIYHKYDPVMSMYYDTFRAWNKHANSYLWIVV